MKMILVLAALVAVCVAAPQGNPKDATIVEQTNDNIGVGPWSWGYKTSDGTSRQESGTINNVGAENESIAVRGTISWVGADGQTYTLNYIADENGFQPSGAHLPQGKK